MTYHICQSCNLPKGALSSFTSRTPGVCHCEPYRPVMDRGHPDTAATEMQRLIDLVASQGRELKSMTSTANELMLKMAATDAAVVKFLAEIATLKLDARARDLELLSDATQYQYMLEAKDAEIAKLKTGHDLYEVVRRMNVAQFREVYVLNCDTDQPFDEIVAGMAHEFGLTVRK